MKALLPLLLAATASAQTVLVPPWVAEAAGELRAKHPALQLVPYSNPAEAVAKAGQAEGFIGTPDAALLEAAPKLRWVHVFSAGIDHYTDLARLKDGRIAMTSLKIHQGPEIADHAFALLLGLTRNMADFQRAQQRGEWTRGAKPALPLIELRGRTLLVVGYGGIGTQVAERAHAFGMSVLAVDPKDIPLTRTLDYCGKPDELDSLLPRADVVASCVPHTAETDRMFGKAQFEAMKDDAIFINVSRGKVVDPDALVAALRERKIAAAGLDALEPEPLPADHPLWKMPNVLITPHVAGVSDGRPARQNTLILENLDRFARGLPLKNLVDPVKGY
jgi:phosphoglycerate dehydrogenase-like enzyme